MIKRVILWFMVLLKLLTFSASADETDLYIDRNVQKLFTSEAGLLSTSTQAIAQTSEGFVWIGGYGGLVRYDGKKFETFAYKRITRVTDLASGSDGELWIATSDKGLFLYRDNEFTTVPCDGDDVSDVECMSFAPDGTLYLGTDSGLCAVEDEVIRRLDIPGLKGQRVEKLLCPERGPVLCTTRSGGLYAWDGEAVRQLKAEEEYQYRGICLDTSNDTYVAGTFGDEVVVFDRDLNAVDTIVMEGLSCINDLHYDDRGALWLCADNGIAIYTDGSIRMQNLQMNNSVDQMMVDSEGNYWFISSRQGVLEVSRSQFGDVSRSAGLGSMVVNAIQRIGDTLYIGHDTGLAAISASDYKKIDTEPLSMLKATRVRALLADSQGRLWIGTMKKGLICLEPGGEVVSYTSRAYPAMLSDNVRAIVETEDGILFGTDKGAYCVSGGEVSNVANDPDALAFRILSVARFGDIISLGSDGNGLYQLRDGEIIRRITTDDGMSSNVIMKEYWSDALHGVWLVTGNDIDFLDEAGNITSIANFPSTNNLDLLVMKNGDAWVFTGSGIYLTTEESLLRDESPKYLLFRHLDGLPYEVTPNSYQCMTDDALYVCGSGGVFSLQTDFLQPGNGDYHLVIDSVKADNQPIFIRPDAPCEIGAAVKRIDINAFVLTFRTGNPFVFYYLEGFDDGETVTQLSKMGDISYTNLNGGSYTFHFGIKDYRTDEVLQEVTLAIVKQHPWYSKPSVRLAGLLLGLLLVALITLLIVWLRSKRIKRTLQKEFEQKEKAHLKKIAYMDYLTGLYTRNYLDVWNAHTPQSEDYPITFVSLDMNDLKKVNDRYGHKNGDQLLCEMANLLKQYFTGDAFAVVRIGGDEFLILARGVDEATMAERLENMTAAAAKVFVNDIPVTFGYGICTQYEGEFNFEDGLRMSDLKLLEQKKQIHGRTDD